MIFTIYFFFVLSIIFAVCTVCSNKPMYSILFLILLLLVTAIIFFLLENYFAGAVEIIIYAGAIIVLFIFILMILNINSIKKEQKNLIQLICPITISTLLLTLFINIIFSNNHHEKYLIKEKTMQIKNIGLNLFSQYIFVVELISLMLLATLIIIVHIGKNFINK